MSIPEKLQYGAIELKAIYNRNLGIAFGIASGAMVAVLLLVMFGDRIGKAEDKKSAPIAKMKLMNLPPPPAEDNAPPPPPPPMIPPELQSASGTGGGVAARAGVPIPVPDALITPDVKDFATTTEIAVATPQGGEGGGFGLGDGDGGLGNVDIKQPVKVKDVEKIPEPDEFIPVETEPQFDLDEMYKRLKYPEIARRNNLEGKVTIRVYVDKFGKPKQTIVEQIDNKVFEESARQAIMNTVFKPAIMNGNSVGVWMSIPIIFKLKN